jgi:septal ring-binding cell division protein DamX
MKQENIEDLASDRDSALTDAGIKILAIRLNFDVPKEFSDELEKEAELQEQLNSLAVEKEANKKKSEIEKELSDAKSAMLVSRAQTEGNLPYITTMQFFDKWDGRVPNVVVGGGV